MGLGALSCGDTAFTELKTERTFRVRPYYFDVTTISRQ